MCLPNMLQVKHIFKIEKRENFSIQKIILNKIQTCDFSDICEIPQLAIKS